MVDVASTEGRDPIADINTINAELEAYNPDLMKRPQVIAANKIDAIFEGDENPVDKLRAEFEPKGIKVFPISAVSGKGLNELLYYVKELLDSIDDTPVIFEKEFFPKDLLDNKNESFTVEKIDETTYAVAGPRVEKMLGYTNLDDEKGFNFFQKFMKEKGIIDKLKELGIQEGDTVKVGEELEFDYYE